MGMIPCIYLLLELYEHKMLITFLITKLFTVWNVIVLILAVVASTYGLIDHGLCVCDKLLKKRSEK